MFFVHIAVVFTTVRSNGRKTVNWYLFVQVAPAQRMLCAESCVMLRDMLVNLKKGQSGMQTY